MDDIRNESMDKFSPNNSEEPIFAKIIYETIQLAKKDYLLDLRDTRELMTNSNYDSFYVHCQVFYEKLMERLQKYLKDVNKTNDEGDTYLHIAVKKNDFILIRILVKERAKLDILNKKKKAPIHIAVSEGYLECVKELGESTINEKDVDGNTPLILATKHNKFDIQDHLLTYQTIDVALKNNDGYTAIHLAAKMGNVKLIEKLLKMKPGMVDIEYPRTKFTPLHFAIFHDNFEATKFLIQTGKASLHMKTINGSTPLMMAISSNNFEIIELLVSEGCDINVQNNDGNTSLHIAIYINNEHENYKAMLKKGPTINMVNYLVEKGANLHIPNCKNMTPLDMITDDNLKKTLKKKENGDHVPEGTIQGHPFEPLDHNGKAQKKGKKEKRKKRKITYDLKSLFHLGDQVCIIRNEDAFKKEAKENPNMKTLPEETGRVKKIEDNKICVRFENCEDTFTPEMLTKVFSVGDVVKLLENVELVKTLQKGNHGWTKEIDEIIGKTGTVNGFEKQTVIVKFDNKSYRLNPMVLFANFKPIQETAYGAETDAAFSISREPFKDSVGRRLN